jgi:carboxyl-terminal processing protease
VTTWKKWRLSLSLLISLTIFGAAVPAVDAESIAQVQEVRQLLEEYHLSKPDDALLSSNEIDTMVESLHDPYTEFFDENEWETFNSALEQTFVGIGIVMSEDNGVVYVQDVLPGGPADSAGILPGDALVSADGKPLKGKTTAELQRSLRGLDGTVVVLGVSRGGKQLKFHIVRKAVHFPTVTARLLGNGVGYLALSGFTSDASSQFKKQLAELEKKGLSSLVIDLRDNGGGYVTAAQEIAGLFVKEGILAHMRDREGVDQPLEVSGTAKPYSVVVLVNGNSASASELLSGALQDYGVAKLAGTQTFGKGVVQSLMPLKSGGMLKVTIQEYFTPKGRKVDKVGLTPDLLLDGSPAEQLVGAFRSAGGKNITMISGRGALTINGVRMPQSGAAINNKSVWYVNFRLGSSMAGAKLMYDGKQRTFTVKRGSKSEVLKTNDSHVVIKNGKALIDVRMLQKWFPEVRWSSAGDTVKLTAG